MVKYRIFILLFWPIHSFAQPPIGQWREHLPYNAAIAVCSAGNKIYAATNQAIMYVDQEDNSLHKLSRVNGLAETGIALMKKNESNSNILIGYSNSNIDLIVKNKIININDIKRKNIIGDKNIYNVFSKNDISYFCCGFGIVAIDESRKETKDTYYIGTNGSNIKVTGMADDQVYFYAATAEGLKRALNNSANLSDYANWQLVTGNGLGSGAVNDVYYFGNRILILKNDSILQWNGTLWNLFYTTANKIASIKISDNKLFVCETNPINQGVIVQLESNGIVSLRIRQSNLPESPKDVIKINNTYWIADFFKGLFFVENNVFTNYTPNAPQGLSSGEMFFNGNILYVAAGAVNESWQYQYNRNGLYKLEENYWSPIWKFNTPAMDTLLDFITIAANDRTIYAGSYGGGLLQLNNNGSIEVYKQNSPLQVTIGDPGSYRVSGLALDTEQNLWVSNYGSGTNLHVLKSDRSWKSFTIPFFINQNAVAQICIDDANQKWIVSPQGNGLICYNQGANLDNTNDDQWRFFKTGQGNGNLPSNEVYCIVKDKDGILWVGTAKGIALIQCASDVFTTNGCAAVLPIVQQDQVAGYLFQNETVQTIAVDGANRKWVGTKNGVWLISSDGEKTIYRFSEDNSPLLSNDVKKIAIHPQTGEVFFATFKGICSFRSTATEASAKTSNVLVFPNPVPPNYKGMIAIKGLANGSIVKITALDGRLVYQTKALGGQAIWNGLNYKGQKVNSGSYLVLATSETNNEKVSAKIFFISN